jgi:hypothetical protein
MKRLATLLGGALLALGASVSLAGTASASVPAPEAKSYSYQFSGPFLDTSLGRKYEYVTVFGDGDVAGNVYFSSSLATNHLGQHTKRVQVYTDAGVDIHVRVDSGSSVVDYHAPGGFTRTFYYPVRKYRVTLDNWATGWFAPAIS